MHQLHEGQTSIRSILSCLPDNANPILIYPTPQFANSKYRYLLSSCNPFLIVVQDPFLTDQGLAKLFIARYQLPFKQRQVFFWQRQSTFPFLNMTITDLANRLDKQSIKGLSLEFNVVAEISHHFQQDIALVWQQSPSTQQMQFYIPRIKHVLQLSVCLPLCGEELSNVRKSIERYLQKELRIKVKSDINLFVMWNNKQTQVNDRNCVKITKRDQILIKLNSFSELSKISQPTANDYIVFNLPFANPKKVPYLKIRAQKIQLIFENHLNFRENGLDSRDFALQVMNIVLLGEDKLWNFGSIESLFVNRDNQVRYICAEIITVPSLLYLDTFTLRNTSISESQPSYEDWINKQAAKTSNSQVENNPYDPITLYTTNQQLAYSCNLSIHMTFEKINKKQHQMMQFLFARDLVKRLKPMPCCQGKVYMLAEHEQAYKVGERLNFKQFLHCSSKKLAQSSQHKALYKLQSCKSARIISQFQSFDVIIMPNTTFEITQFVPKNSKQQIDVVVMKQVFQEKCKPSSVRVLWVNKQINEGLAESKQQWVTPKNMIYFIHLSSTSQLEQWLKDNITKASQQRVALITNMVRKQKGLINENAGAEAIKVLKKYKEQGEFFVFVGRAVEAVIANLRERGIKVDEKQVSHKIADLQAFIKRLIFE